MSRTY